MRFSVAAKSVKHSLISRKIGRKIEDRRKYKIGKKGYRDRQIIC
jgi:hypothetical protein